MQLPGNREALHLHLGRDNEKEEPFQWLSVEDKLRSAISWQRCCHPHTHTIACQSQLRHQ
jgi:hypothetical protein